MFQIRDATMSDLDVVRAIFREASLSNDEDREVLLSNPEALEMPDTAIREVRTRVATVQAEGERIVGFATVAPQGEMAEIEDLFVDPQWLGRGIGRRLVEDLVARARQAGVRRVEVSANDHAYGFYTRVGFVANGQVQTVFGPAQRMLLDLDHA